MGLLLRVVLWFLSGGTYVIVVLMVVVVVPRVVVLMVVVVLMQWFSNFLCRVPPQKIFVSPSTIIMTDVIKYNNIQ